MNELKEFKQKRKALKARIKSAKQEVKALETELKSLRQNAQHDAVDDLETWMNKGDTTRSTLIARVVNFFRVCRKSGI
ncbi:hypothetical protein M3P05_01920 [Sansalvadorimonas sp. 2012CJ34-2]|uniref:Uncharacterized protein n=1 Tax=Parendozoicomonas callyspongiae TaxID=2942213 RepID=A0ABT0PBW2_9GAMM|nr:hypothetical protein [Sansalvadorimonas sp. 2012CJ34-2]MCL6268711.1 hypothetical protein [Sansalvadorimonas sp. 2012CJ34-2]